MRSTPGRPETTGPLPARSMVGAVASTVALQAGFYVFGIGAVVALAAVPFLQLRVEDRIGISGFAAAWAAASLAWALIPPWTRPAPPETVVDRDAAPGLHRLVDEVARALGRTPPDQIALLIEPNALVGRYRRGLRRVHWLGIGLPLLHEMSVDQLRAVVAHELGHLHHGDLRLGPWIYGTRQAIVRSLDRMDRDGVGLHLLFHWYGRLYLRTSQAVSRRQELHADRLAADICGREAVISALQTLHALAPSWHRYWFEDCLPLLDRGLRPPILAGFELHRRHNQDRQQVDEETPEQPRIAGPYDSHPSLEKRCDALQGAGPLPHEADRRPAIGLLADPHAIEATLVRDRAVDHAEFPTIRWQDVGTQVWLPWWREQIRPYDRSLRCLRPRDLAAAIAELDNWANKLRAGGPAVLSPEAARRRAASLLAMGFAVTLADLGWDLDFAPGAPIRFTKDGMDIDPFTAVEDLRNGRLSPEDWARSLDERPL